MTDPAAEGARAAAHRLTTQHGPGLVTDVEAALHARDASRRPDQYLDPISLSSLIVSAAALAWTVYNDLKKKTSTPAADVITRTVRTELRRTRTMNAHDDEVIAITVQETLTILSAQPETPHPPQQTGLPPSTT